MGKNTPERQEFIIDNLKVEEDLEKDMKKLSVKNYNQAKLLNIFIYSFLMISFFIPLFIILFLESSEIAHVFINNPLILILLISLQIYFFYRRSYYSRLKLINI